MTETILIVDDVDLVRVVLAELLGNRGYRCQQAADAAEARRWLERERFDLLMCDVNMPGESGIELIRDVLADSHDVAVVMVTGEDDSELAEEALRIGAYGYILKPFRPSEVLIGVSNALRRRGLEAEARRHMRELRHTVDERTADLAQALADLHETEEEVWRSREQTITRLAAAVEFRSEETGLHIERMSRYSELLAGRLGLPPNRCELIRMASPMHDVGKIGIPDRILTKPGRLTAEERLIMQRHTEIGHRILAGAEGELLQLAAIIALTHHERHDGRGYPRNLAADDIPLEGRIVAVADVFDALTSDRVYRPAMEVEEAVEIMLEGRSTQFDPAVLDRFVDSLDVILSIREAYAGRARHESNTAR